MKIVFYITCALFCLSSCVSKEDIYQRNLYAISSLLVEEFGQPIKPPPPPEGEKYRFTPSQIDSIMNREQKVALFPVFYVVEKNFSKNKKLGEEYDLLVRNLRNYKTKKPIDISKIKTDKLLNLSLIDTLKLKSDKRYVNKNYDVLIYLSHISFNDTYDKAVLVVGSTKGYLNGSASLVYLEKINGLWETKNVHTFEIS